MNASCISTVFKENATIENFLNSILNQSKKPDEIVIVDGKSMDKTVDRIKNYELQIKRKNVHFRFFIKAGNRSVGRNEAIRQATGDIIVCSDAGCILDKHWLERITKPFQQSEIDVVAGYYYPKTASLFEKALATYTCVMPDKVNPNDFLPSSRSIAFRKTAWEKVGGYPEELDTCEDLIFAKRLKEAGCRFIFVKDAFVLWPQRKNLKEAFWQFFQYAKGDGMAQYFRPQTPLLFSRYFFVLLLMLLFLFTHQTLLIIFLLILIFLYCFWAIWKNYRYVNHISAFYFLPLLQLISDVAVLCGMTLGIITAWGTRKTS